MSHRPPPKTKLEDFRKLAHMRLDSIINEAVKGKRFGWQGIDLLFKNGEGKTIRTRTEFTEEV